MSHKLVTFVTCVVLLLVAEAPDRMVLATTTRNGSITEQVSANAGSAMCPDHSRENQGYGQKICLTGKQQNRCDYAKINGNNGSATVKYNWKRREQKP